MLPKKRSVPFMGAMAPVDSWISFWLASSCSFLVVLSVLISMAMDSPKNCFFIPMLNILVPLSHMSTQDSIWLALLWGWQRISLGLTVHV